MQYKQLKLIILFLLVLGQATLQAQLLHVKQSNGTQTDYALSSIKKLSFSQGNLTVTKTDNSNGVYALSALRYLNYSDFPTIRNRQKDVPSQMILAYPNPASDMLYIDLSCAADAGGTISLLTIEGKTVISQPVINEVQLSFDISHLPKGIYFCLYKNSAETKTLKIVKQ